MFLVRCRINARLWRRRTASPPRAQSQERRLLAENLRKAWRAQTAARPTDACMAFCRQGLVLGAGCVLAPAEEVGETRQVRLAGREDRLLALLSAAYGRRVGPEVLGHIRHGAELWNAGDESSAAVHLAPTRLEPLSQPNAAMRLFLAEVLSEAGAEPPMILRALGLQSDVQEEAIKFFNPQQPRIPKGEPGAGQWVRDTQAARPSAATDASGQRSRSPPGSVVLCRPNGRGPCAGFVRRKRASED